MTETMSAGKPMAPLILGVLPVAGAGVALYLLPGVGPGHAATGVVAGFGVAYVGFLLYYALLPRGARIAGSVWSSYLPGATVRYVVMIATFSVVVFVLKVHTLSVLLGTFIGMMASTFISLNAMRRKTQQPPEA